MPYILYLTISFDSRRNVFNYVRKNQYDLESTVLGY